MNWTQVKDKMPPLEKRILLGRIIYQGCNNDFEWFTTSISRPYNKNPMYNPNYFIYYRYNQDTEEPLSPYDFWMEISKPSHEDLLEDE